MNVTGNAVFGITAAVLDTMPGSARDIAARISALGLLCLSPGKRRNLRRNLSAMGAPAGNREILGIFRNHSLNMMEMFASSRWSGEEIDRRIEFPCSDLLEEALSEGRGAIFATAHIGNWELPAFYLASRGYRLSVVAGEQMNSLLTDPVRRAKEDAGIEVIGPGSPYRRLYRTLREGGIVALLLDGDVFEGGTPAKLFGRTVTLPRGAARLAMGTGAPVMGTFCRRIGGGRSKISMETILAPHEAGRLGEETAQRRIFGALEGYIRDNSDQWCIFRDFWKGAA